MTRLHPSLRLSFIVALACAVSALTSSSPVIAAEPTPLNICLLSASGEYKSDESLGKFQKLLEEHLHAKCTLLIGKDKGDNLPELKPLADADVMVVFTRRVQLGEEQLAAVQKFCKAGRGIVGMRTASHAFANWPEFDKAVLGGNYSLHFPEGKDTEVTLNAKAADHPILAGVKPITSHAKLYKNPSLADDVTLLATGLSDGHTEPVAWARTVDKTRVFYTSLGDPNDFQNESFLRMLENAVQWTGRREGKK